MSSLICKPWEVAGIQSGKITQLVRPVMPQPESGWTIVHNGNSFTLHQDGECDFDEKGICKNYKVIECPFGKPGGRLKVLEPFYAEWINDDGGGFAVDYAADVMNEADFDLDDWQRAETMPQEFSRLTLEVLSVRVERFEDFVTSSFYPMDAELDEDPEDESVRFHEQWNTEYPETPWESNPWVFIREVRKVEV